MAHIPIRLGVTHVWYNIDVIELLLLLLSTTMQPADAAEPFLSYGMGTSNSASSRTIGVGVISPMSDYGLLQIVKYKLAAGGWIENFNKNQNSAYICGQTGLSITSYPFVASSMHGIGGISATDRLLGSHFQFFHDMTFGLKDQNTGASISVGYQHVSNANLFPGPNLGRDYIVITLTVKP